MATNATNISNVTDIRTDKEGNPIKNLKTYDQFSENAYATFDPITFNSFGNIMRTTNRNLATIIKENYQKIFHDLRGVYIAYYPGSPAPFMVEFYFAKNIAPKPEDKIANLKDLTVMDAQHNNLYYQKQVLNNKVGGKHYTLNDDTKIILGDIMFGGKDANKPNQAKWNNFIEEVWVPTVDQTFRPGSGELLIKVSKCFDIHRILQKVMPEHMLWKIENKDDGAGNSKAVVSTAVAKYECRFIKFTYNDPFVFIMNIEQFDKNAVEEMTASENPTQRIVSGVVYY